jgi:hypothetical protein
MEIFEALFAAVIEPEKQGRDHKNKSQGKPFSQGKSMHTTISFYKELNKLINAHSLRLL